MTHPVSGCGASQTEDRRSPRARGQRKRRPCRPSTGFSHGRDPRWRPRPQEAGPPARRVSAAPARGPGPGRPLPLRLLLAALPALTTQSPRGGRVFGLGPWFPGFGSRPAPAWARCSAGCCRRCGEGGAVGGRWVLGAGGPRPRSLARGSPRLRAGPGPGPHRACVRRAATRRARVLRDRSEGGSRRPRSRGLRREVPGGGDSRGPQGSQGAGPRGCGGAGRLHPDGPCGSGAGSPGGRGSTGSQRGGRRGPCVSLSLCPRPRGRHIPAVGLLRPRVGSSCVCRTMRCPQSGAVVGGGGRCGCVLGGPVWL